MFSLILTDEMTVGAYIPSFRVDIYQDWHKVTRAVHPMEIKLKSKLKIVQTIEFILLLD